MPTYYYCDYNGCFNRNKTGTSISFFRVPIDKDLKLLWIKHSGNESLYKNPDLKKIIKFCEEHFCKDDIIVRGTRKILKENAILKSVNAKYCSCSSGSIDKDCEKVINSVFQINSSKTQHAVLSVQETEKLAPTDLQLYEKEIPIPAIAHENDPLIINDIKIDLNPSSLSINCYQNACRICLKDVDINTKITDNFDSIGDGLKINDILKTCFKFENCNENDNYPQKICKNCLNELHTVYNFYMKFSYSNDKLKISNNEIKKEVIDEFNIADQNNTQKLNVNEKYLINGTNFIETIFSEIPQKIDGEENSIMSDGDQSSTLKVHKNVYPKRKVLNSDENELLDHRKSWNKQHTTSKPLRTYMTSKRTNQLYTCKFCDKNFILKENLDNHLKTHETGNNTYHEEKCIICESDFNSKKELIIHIKKNHIVYKFSCDVCEQGYTQKSSLDSHKLAHSNHVSDV